MYKLILLFSLITSIAQAQSLESLLTTALSSTPVDCPPEQLENACAIDLCGPPNAVTSIQVSMETLEAKYSDKLKDKEKKLKDLEKKMRLYLESHNENLKNLRSMLAAAAPKVDFSKWSEFEIQQGEYDVFDQNIMFKFDKTKPANDRVSFEVRAPEWMNEEEKKVLRSYAESMKSSYLKDKFTMIQNEVATPEELKLAIKEVWDGIAKQASEEDVKWWKPRIENLDAHEKDLETFFNHLTRLKYSIKGIPANTPYVPKCTDPNCQALMAKSLEKKFDSEYKSFSEIAASYNISDKDIADRAKTCLASHIVKEEMNQKAQAFEKNLPIVMNDFVTKGMANFSAHSKNAFQDFVKNKVSFQLKYNKPLDINEHIANMKEPGHPEKKLREIQSLILNPFSAMDECMGIYVKSDRVFQKDGKSVVELSYHTCTHEGSGNKILAHELGHVLSYAVSKGHLSPESKEQFIRARDCVTSRHKYETSGSIYNFGQPTDRRHTEEDHADFMSQATYSTGSLFSCSLLQQSPHRTKFIVSSAKSELQHTTEFMTLIWEANARTKALPKSCENALAKNKDYDLKSCNEFR